MKLDSIKVTAFAHIVNDELIGLYHPTPRDLPQEEVHQLITVSHLIEIGQQIDSVLELRETAISETLVNAVTDVIGDIINIPKSDKKLKFSDAMLAAEFTKGFIGFQADKLKETKERLKNAESALEQINNAYLKEAHLLAQLEAKLIDVNQHKRETTSVDTEEPKAVDDSEHKSWVNFLQALHKSGFGALTTTQPKR